ncbi:hypothetical protein [Paenibacillus sp. 32352]|uniref:hypothetical protein n=1 Tax=Paenibacillus sp. 32352 TaxID=1969111 RepID=UPI0009ADDDAB|nr:hypothetical protein [Paenibacillus sp. 32352]
MKKFILGLICGIALTAAATVYATDTIQTVRQVNTEYQKLFLLLLVGQLDNNINTKRIEFWSNKENALAYVSGNYEKDGVEGWSGMNSRFGLLLRDGDKVSLSHILSVHERDVISIGKYQE